MLHKAPGNVLGCDFAGVVVQIGHDVPSGLRFIGERVAGSVHGGIGISLLQFYREINPEDLKASAPTVHTQNTLQCKGIWLSLCRKRCPLNMLRNLGLHAIRLARLSTRIWTSPRLLTLQHLVKLSSSGLELHLPVNMPYNSRNWLVFASSRLPHLKISTSSSP